MMIFVHALVWVLQVHLRITLQTPIMDMEVLEVVMREILVAHVFAVRHRIVMAFLIFQIVDLNKASGK